MQPYFPTYYNKHITILYCMILIIHNFSQHNCKLPDDGVLTRKYVGVILIFIFTLLVCAQVGTININSHSRNIKISDLRLKGLLFMGTCIVSIFRYISNKMQRYTVYLFM